MENQQKEHRRIEAYRKELEADPKSLVFVALAEALNRIGEFEDAVQVAQRGLQNHRDSVAGRLALAVAEAGRSNVRAALEQIKAALIVDQENPRALALMGSLLLQKGLARRAVQFLSQAVKLAPDIREYADLLRRAWRLAKTESPVPLPMVRGENVPQGESPWTGDEEPDDGPTPESRHTVFGPDAAAPSKPPPAALKPMESPPSDSELTHFSGPAAAEKKPPSVRARRSRYEPLERMSSEERTTFDIPDALVDTPPIEQVAPHSRGKTPMVGGSAAVQSGRDDDADLVSAGPDEATVAAPQDAFVNSPTMDGILAGSHDEVAAERPDSGDATVAMGSAHGVVDDLASEKRRVRGPMEAPSVVQERTVSKESLPPDKSLLAEPTPRPEPEPEPTPAAEPDPPPKSDDGKPSTMFVDDAVWAIYGGERPPAAEQKKAPGDERKDKPARKASVALKGWKRRSVMVIRTSAGFGEAARWISLALLIGLAVWGGYSTMLARSGAAPTDASEELKGIASDLERGGLASLLVAEEAAQDLMPRAPELEPLLKGVLAHVHARIWSDFGGDPTRLERAQEMLASLNGESPTVELLSAKVALSTAAAERAALDATLGQVLERFPGSPKAWVLRAEIAGLGGRAEDALRALYRARSLHRERRGTLLALARWHARRGAHDTALSFFAELEAQDSLREDVEVALERYALGKIAAEQESDNNAESRLAGLVREELPQVAKDEAGRVALVFAVTMFGRGDREGALAQLATAESAFARSVSFRCALGGVLLAAGEWARAREQFERALEIDGDDDDLRVALARVRFGEEAKLRRRPIQNSTARGDVLLPFGRVRFVVGRFELIEVEPDRALFPEHGYARARAAATGEALVPLLDAENLLAVARRELRAKRVRAAIRALDQARTIRDSTEIEIVLGRAYLRLDELEAGRQAFARALKLDPKNTAARFGLGQTLARQGDVVDAIDTLQPLTAGELIAPEAFRLLASLRRQRGDDQRAVELLEKIRLVEGADAGLLVEIGRLHHQRKSFDTALASYRDALAASNKLRSVPRRRSRKSDQDTRNGVDLYYLGRVLSETNQRRGAQLLFSAAKRDDAPADAHYYLGKTLMKRRRTRRAGRNALKRYLRMAPDGEFTTAVEQLLRGR